MEVRIIPLALHDRQKAGHVLGEAFRDDPATRMMLAESGGDERVGHMTTLFRNMLFNCQRRGSPLVAKQGEEVLGAVSAYPPGAFPVPLTDQAVMMLRSMRETGIFIRQTWTALYRGLFLMGEMTRNHPKGPHYYVEILGVRPGSQRNGTGSLMLGAFTQKADEERVGCYLETANPRNLPFYERHGFRINGETAVLGVPLWFLWRGPGSFSS